MVKKTLASSLVVALLLGMGSAAPAASEDAKPLLVVSLASYDEMIGDIELIGKISENPDLAKGLEAMLKLFTRSRGLAGVDKARCWGAVLDSDGDKLSGYAFLPVTSLKELLSALEPIVGKAEELDDGVYQVRTDDGPLYAKQKGDWAIVVKNPFRLAETPSDPGSLVAGMTKNYDLAARFFVKNVPTKFRDQFVTKMKQDVRRDLKRRPGEKDLEYEIRESVTRGISDTVVRVLDELDEVTLGWALDHEKEKSYLDVSISALPGTLTAAALEQFSQGDTQFSGFRLPEATMTAGWAGKITHLDMEAFHELKSMVRRQITEEIARQNKPEEEVELAIDLVDGTLELISKVLKKERIDGAAAVMLKSDAATLVAGVFVADGSLVEKGANRLLEVLRQAEPVVADWVTVDADECEGVTFHTASIPIPPDAEDREKVVRLVDEKLELVLGISEENLYVAAGRDALETLKKAVKLSADEGPESVPPLQWSLSVRSLMQFVAEMGDTEEERAQAALVVEALSKTSDQDHVTLTMMPVSRGVRIRVELEQELLRLIGKASLMAGLGGPGAASILGGVASY